jgi:glycerate kinase
MRVVLAPDSFKCTVSAVDVAEALREGWLSVRPDDEVIGRPMADGGEGTLAIVATANPTARLVPATVTGPVGGVIDTTWLLLADGTAVVEAARVCGLPMLREPDALGASSRGLGELLFAVTDHPDVVRVLVALGGTATTDGGSGVLSALGAVFRDDRGAELGPSATARPHLAAVDLGQLRRPPPGGVVCLVDVDVPLLGPRGAAAQFGPQKGAAAADVRLLEAGLRQLSLVLGGAPDQPGAGAAGGIAYGLAAGWGATIGPGAATISAVIGLAPALAGADVVVTGEGRYDSQSHQGKVVGHVLDLAQAAGVSARLVAGSIAISPPRTVVDPVDLTVLAGDLTQAMADPRRWLIEAGRRLARRVVPTA